MYLWVLKVIGDGILLTGEVICQKWNWFADLVSVPKDERLNLSNGFQWWTGLDWFTTGQDWICSTNSKEYYISTPNRQGPVSEHVNNKVSIGVVQIARGTGIGKHVDFQRETNRTQLQLLRSCALSPDLLFLILNGDRAWETNGCLWESAPRCTWGCLDVRKRGYCDFVIVLGTDWFTIFKLKSLVYKLAR